MYFLMNKWFRFLNAKYPDITIERVHYGTEDLRSNFQTACLSGEGPVLIMGPNDNMGTFVTAGYLKPIDELMDSSFINKFDTKIMDSVKIDDHYYAVPMVNGNNIAMLYNKNLVDKAPTSYQDIIDLDKKYNDGSVYPLVYNEAEAYWFIGFLGGFGGKVFDNSGKITLDTPEMIKALQFVHDLKYKYKIMPKQADYNIAESLFKEGKSSIFKWIMGMG